MAVFTKRRFAIVIMLVPCVRVTRCSSAVLRSKTDFNGLRHGHTKEEAKGMFKSIDEEATGVVQWTAFRKWYTGHYVRFMEEAQRTMLDDVVEQE